MLGDSQGIEEGKVYSDTKHKHYAVIETEHPYKQACVTHHKVRSPVVTVNKFTYLVTIIF